LKIGNITNEDEVENKIFQNLAEIRATEIEINIFLIHSIFDAANINDSVDFYEKSIIYLLKSIVNAFALKYQIIAIALTDIF